MASVELFLMTPSLRDLLAHPGRYLLAQSARFRSASMADALIRHAKDLNYTDINAAIDASGLAVAMARFYGGVLLTRALAEHGNSLRIGNRFRRSRETLLEASRLSRPEGSEVHIDVLSYQASLAETTRDLVAAKRYLDLALGFQTPNKTRARLLAQGGILEQYRGRPSTSVRLLKQASSLVEPGEARLSLAIAQSLAAGLAEAGRPEGARIVLESCSPLRRRASEGEEIKFRWVEGKVSASAGHLQAARHAFSVVRAFFDGRKLPYEHGLVTLELALVLLRMGFRDDAGDLAREAGQDLESLGVGRDAFLARMIAEAAANPDPSALATSARALLLWCPADAEEAA